MTFKNEMFQKREVQEMKCFRNVTLKNEMIKKRDVQLNFKKRAVQMFMKCDVQKMKCFRKVKFERWNVSET